jgi:peptidyl-prolyl cis-trans isomerase SurA
MRKIPAVIALLAVLAAAVPSAGQEVVEEIVAVVNDDIITLSEYKDQLEIAMAQLRSMPLSPEDYEKQVQALRDQLLDIMITDLLLLQKARELNLNVSEQLRATLDKIKADNNMASDDDLRRAVQQQGMSYDVWLREYEETMLKQAIVYTEVERGLALDDSEVVQYYRRNPKEFTLPTQYKIHAIYLSTETHGTEELEALEARIEERLKAGTAFADVAAEFSDPPMKEAKGDLGTFKEGELDETLEEAVAKLKDGETSPWVFARNGWWLLQLEEKTPSRLMTFEEARSDVVEMLYEKMRDEKTEEFLKALREKSYVKILRPNPLDR